MGYIRVSEAARLAGVARPTIYRWLRGGTLAGVYDHGAYYVRWVALVHVAGAPASDVPPDLGNDPGPLPEGCHELGAEKSAQIPDTPVPVAPSRLQ